MGFGTDCRLQIAQGVNLVFTLFIIFARTRVVP